MTKNIDITSLASIRLLGVLERLRLAEVEELRQFTAAQLKRVPQVGRKTLQEIQDLLAQKGLKLGTPIETPEAVTQVLAAFQKMSAEDQRSVLRGLFKLLPAEGQRWTLHLIRRT